MPTKPIKVHAIRKGTSLTLCGFNGPTTDDKGKVTCGRCNAIMRGGFGQTVSQRFNFPLNPAKWAAQQRGGAR